MSESRAAPETERAREALERADAILRGLKSRNLSDPGLCGSLDRARDNIRAAQGNLALRATLGATAAQPAVDYRALAEAVMSEIERYRGDKRGYMSQMIVDVDDIREALIRLKLRSPSVPVAPSPILCDECGEPVDEPSFCKSLHGTTESVAPSEENETWREKAVALFAGARDLTPEERDAYRAMRARLAEPRP